MPSQPRKGEDYETFRTRNNQYMRRYMRERRGRTALNELEQEATARSMTTQQLTNALVDVIVRRKMFAMLLD